LNRSFRDDILIRYSEDTTDLDLEYTIASKDIPGIGSVIKIRSEFWFDPMLGPSSYIGRSYKGLPIVRGPIKEKVKV